MTVGAPRNEMLWLVSTPAALRPLGDLIGKALLFGRGGEQGSGPSGRSEQWGGSRYVGG